MAAITKTVYICPVCGGEFDRTIQVPDPQHEGQYIDKSAAEQEADCESSHPGTMQFARAAQSYKAFEVMPDAITITHGGVAYKYYLK